MLVDNAMTKSFVDSKADELLGQLIIDRIEFEKYDVKRGLRNAFLQ